MFVIECPWCGPRDQQEFHCAGEDRGARPSQPEAVDDKMWSKYVFMRRNPKGDLNELWQHRHGCRRWFAVLRNTADDRILAVRPIAGTRESVAGAPSDCDHRAGTKGAVASDASPKGGEG